MRIKGLRKSKDEEKVHVSRVKRKDKIMCVCGAAGEAYVNKSVAGSERQNHNSTIG
jgi:hypothetical protein